MKNEYYLKDKNFPTLIFKITDRGRDTLPNVAIYNYNLEKFVENKKYRDIIGDTDYITVKDIDATIENARKYLSITTT